jgi:serine/threonine protein kinase
MKIDVWALGIAFFGLATRTLPFECDDEYSNVADVLAEEADLSALTGKCAPSFIELIRAMLQREPRKRPTAEECLRSKWFSEDNGGQNDSPNCRHE